MQNASDGLQTYRMRFDTSAPLSAGYFGSAQCKLFRLCLVHAISAPLSASQDPSSFDFAEDAQD